MAVSRINPDTVLLRLKFDVEPAGLVNGVNTTYLLPEKYVTGKATVYINGVKQTKGVTFDYIEVESGGPTTGFDAVSFVGLVPLPGDNIRVDYLAAP